MIVESFNINSQPPVRLQDAVINRDGRELPVELNEDSSEVFADLISKMIENYSDYSDVTAITVGDARINIMFDKQSSGMYCYAVSVEANGYEKIFREAVQLYGGYVIEFADTDNGFAFGQTKNGIGDWWVFSDSGVYEATDCDITYVISGKAELELSEMYIKDDVLYHGYTGTNEESFKFSFAINYLDKNYESYKDLHSIRIGEFLLKIKFYEHEVLPGETVMYSCLESITANGQELVVNDGWDHGGSAYLGGMLFCANAPENVFVFTKNSNITKTWIFTEKEIIEVPIGNYWDESQPEFYNTSIYNFTMRDDGKLGYIRRPYKALQSVDILGQLYYVVSRDELGREEGYVTIENGEIVYNLEKIYTISDLYDLDDYFKQWLLQRSTWDEEILESYGIFGTANSLDELLEYNAQRYEPAK